MIQWPDQHIASLVKLKRVTKTTSLSTSVGTTVTFSRKDCGFTTENVLGVIASVGSSVAVYKNSFGYTYYDGKTDTNVCAVRAISLDGSQSNVPINIDILYSNN